MGTFTIRDDEEDRLLKNLQRLDRSIPDAQTAGQISLKARTSLVAHVEAVAKQSILSACANGQQSCSFKIEPGSMASWSAKQAEGILTKLGYKASHRVNSDSSVTVAVTWLPNFDKIDALLQKGV